MAKLIPEYIASQNSVSIGSQPSAVQATAITEFQQQPYIAQGLQQFGAGVSAAAQAYQQNQNLEDNLWLTKTMSETRLNWQRSLIDRENSAIGSAAGFSKTLEDDYNKYTQETLEKAPNENIRTRLDAELTLYKTALVGQGIQFENDRSKKYQVDQMDATTDDNAKTVVLKPELAANVTAGFKRLLDSMPHLPADLKNQIFKMQNEKIQNAFYGSMVAKDPKALLNMFNPFFGAKKFEAGTPENIITKASDQIGANALDVLIAGSIESKLNPKQKKTSIAESSAYGTFQFVNKTAKQYGITKDSSFEDQARAAAQFTKDNTNFLRNELEAEPTSAQVYLAHHFGATGAVNLLNADPNAPIEDVIGKSTAQQNKIDGKTVGQVLKENDKLVKQHAAKFQDKQKTIDEGTQYIINSSSADKILYYKHQAEQAVQQQAAQQRQEYQQIAQDHEALAYDGKIIPNPLTHEQIMSMYPTAEQGEREWIKYKDTVQLGYDINSMSNMLPADRNALLAKYSQMQPSEKGYAEYQKRFAELARANDLVNKQIAKDPASFITQHSPLLQQKFNVMNAETDPTRKTALQKDYYSALFAAEQAQGVQFPKLLTVNEENADVEFIKNSEGQNVAQMISQLSQKYGEYWPQAYQQLANNDHFPNAALVISSLPNSDINTKVEIGNIANIKLEDMKKNVAENVHKSISAASEKETRNFVNSMPLGLNNQKTINAFHETWEKLALSYARNNNANDAMNMATKALFKNYSFKDNKALPSVKQRIPANDVRFTPDEIEAGISASKKIDTKNLILPIDTTNARTIGSLAKEYGQILPENAIWTTNDDETGMYLSMLTYNGHIVPVYTKDGKQFSQSWDQLKALGKGFSRDTVAEDKDAFYDARRGRSPSSPTQLLEIFQ